MSLKPGFNKKRTVHRMFMLFIKFFNLAFLKIPARYAKGSKTRFKAMKRTVNASAADPKIIFVKVSLIFLRSF